MIIMTIGELIWAPTSIAFVAKVAPIDMRGRYMGVYGMVIGVSWGVGPILSGYFYDNISPVSIWHLSLAQATLGTVAFVLIGRMVRAARQPSPAVNPEDETP
jgi:MFS family permease